MSSLIALLLLFVGQGVSEEPVHLYKVTVPGLAMDGRSADPPPLPTVVGVGPIVVASDDSLEGLIERYFPPSEWETAYRVAMCESDGNPNATGALGEASFFQLHPVHFWRFAQFASPNPWNPEQNVIVASQLQREQGWGIWSCA